MIIDGKKIAHTIIETLRMDEVSRGFLAIFCVGSDSITQSFVTQKKKTADALGVDLRVYEFSCDETNDSLRKKIGTIVRSQRCVGALLQLPFPSHISSSYLANTIPLNKDIDMLSVKSLKALQQGSSLIISPAAHVVEHVLSVCGSDLQTFKKIVVVGQGTLVGSPITAWLRMRGLDVLVIDKGDDISSCFDADLVIFGVGKPGLVKASDLKKGACVIDFGYGRHPETGVLQGDVTPDDTSHLGCFTPTPGGTGPILVASLFENFYTCYQYQSKK